MLFEQLGVKLPFSCKWQKGFPGKTWFCCIGTKPTHLHSLCQCPLTVSNTCYPSTTRYTPTINLTHHLYIIGLCIPAKQKLYWALSLHNQTILHPQTSLYCSDTQGLQSYDKQSEDHNRFLLMKIWILCLLGQPLLQRGRTNELSPEGQIWHKPYRPSKTALQE